MIRLDIGYIVEYSMLLSESINSDHVVAEKRHHSVKKLGNSGSCVFIKRTQTRK